MPPRPNNNRPTTREVATSLVVGLLLLGLGGIVVCFGLAELLYWLAPVLHRWGAYLIVGGLGSAIGAGLSYYGYQEFRASDLLLEESAEALKENLEWTTKPK
jgi:hypothetical protein